MRKAPSFLLPCSLLVAFWLPGCATSDKGPTEPERLVKELSWESVHGKDDGESLGAFPSGYPAQRLLTIGKPATPALLAVLEDPARGVAAHLVLTKIYYPDRTEATSEYSPDRVQRTTLGRSVIGGVSHTVNGLRWYWDASGDHANPADLKANAARWRKEVGAGAGT